MILEGGELIITQISGEPHQRAVLEICRQVGNYIIPHHELAFSADMSRLGEFQGRAPDAVVFSEFGSPEFVSHSGSGACRVVIEFDHKNRSAPELRKHCKFLTRTSPGSLLRAIVAMKLYPNGACIAVVYLPDANYEFEFHAAYSFGRAALTSRETYFWKANHLTNHPAASMLPPVPYDAAVTESLYTNTVGLEAFNMSIPAASVWHDIRDAGGALLPMPAALGPLNIDLREIARQICR
jgi:hypothetical protein